LNAGLPPVNLLERFTENYNFVVGDYAGSTYDNPGIPTVSIHSLAEYRRMRRVYTVCADHSLSFIHLFVNILNDLQILRLKGLL